MLSEKFNDFKVVVDYDPSEPAQNDIRNYGICEAKERAAEAIRHTSWCWWRARRVKVLRQLARRRLASFDIWDLDGQITDWKVVRADIWYNVVQGLPRGARW